MRLLEKEFYGPRCQRRRRLIYFLRETRVYLPIIKSLTFLLLRKDIVQWRPNVCTATVYSMQGPISSWPFIALPSRELLTGLTFVDVAFFHSAGFVEGRYNIEWWGQDCAPCVVWTNKSTTVHTRHKVIKGRLPGKVPVRWRVSFRESVPFKILLLLLLLRIFL